MPLVSELADIAGPRMTLEGVKHIGLELQRCLSFLRVSRARGHSAHKGPNVDVTPEPGRSSSVLPLPREAALGPLPVPETEVKTSNAA